MKRGKKSISSTTAVTGAAVLACAACCAGPLLAIVGSVGAASLLGSYWIPGLLAIAVLAGIAVTILLIRRRRAKACRLPASRLDADLLRAPSKDEDAAALSSPGPKAP
jgi:type VI protein secretion system component VasK